MRKEVKRSLLLWPAVASATITTISLLNLGSPGLPSLQTAMNAFKDLTGTSVARLRGDQEEIKLPIPASIDSLMIDESPLAKIEITARSEHGTRAMKLPQRVADVFSVKAPHRDTQQEMAGLDMQPAEDSQLLQLSQDLLAGEMLAAEEMTTSPSSEEEELDLLIQSLFDSIVDEHEQNEALVINEPEIAEEVVEEPTTEPSAEIDLLVGPDNQPAWEPVGEAVLEKVEDLDASDVKDSILPESTRVLAKQIFDTPDLAGVETPSVSESAVQKPRVSRVIPASPTGWPVSKRLDEQLETLKSLAMQDTQRSRDQLVSATTNVRLAPAASWSQDVSQTLLSLQSLPRIGDSQAGSLLDELAELAKSGEKQAEKTEDRAEQIEWLRAAHALTRRLSIWRPVYEITNPSEHTWMVSDEPNLPSLKAAILSVEHDIQSSGDQQGWNDYLLMDEIEDAENRPSDQRAILAQRFLSRLTWHGLDPEHQQWLSRPSVVALSEAIQPWAHDAVDYANLLSQIERQESNAIDLVAIDIASAVQTLRFAESEQAVKVADAINTYYRNANVRMAISQAMLQRMIPSIAPKTVPIRTQMFGSRVRGISRIESDLQVALTPSPNTWSISLNAVGGVSTRSTGFNGPVAVRTSGNASFVASTPIQITPNGAQVGTPQVSAHGRQRLRGIETDYDGWPLVGSLVRSIAANRYESLAGPSNRIANNKIKGEVASEIDQQVNQRLSTATNQMSQMVLGPLGKLSLDPKVIDMQTTDQRLLARYRLAGDWQMAAFTPRPRAPGASLMSLQIHQSAINNTLEQLVPRDEPKLIRDMLLDSAEKFGQTIELPEDFPEDVKIQFAKTRPITIEIEEGRVFITLRVMRLQRGDRLNLTQFIVRSEYKPEINGLEANLAREGHLRISGPGMSMRERLPVRAIFNKVLSPNRKIQLTLPQLIDHPATAGLAISQLELRAGWLGLALSPENAARIAMINTED